MQAIAALPKNPTIDFRVVLWGPLCDCGLPKVSEHANYASAVEFLQPALREMDEFESSGCGTELNVFRRDRLIATLTVRLRAAA